MAPPTSSLTKRLWSGMIRCLPVSTNAKLRLHKLVMTPEQKRLTAEFEDQIQVSKQSYRQAIFTLSTLNAHCAQLLTPERMRDLKLVSENNTEVPVEFFMMDCLHFMMLLLGGPSIVAQSFDRFVPDETAIIKTIEGFLTIVIALKQDGLMDKDGNLCLTTTHDHDVMLSVVAANWARSLVGIPFKTKAKEIYQFLVTQPRN